MTGPGRLDLPRARALAQATTGCPDPTARRVDALLDLFRRVRDGQPLPAGAGAGRRGRALGLVLHGDTFFGDGPA
ncbi:MAG: hypothetical protein ACXV3V_05005, partial [Actinomycetes bacterium]